MSQVSPAKVKASQLVCVFLVVKDAQKTMENYWNILGIGPWDILSWEAPLVYDYRYRGKPAQGRAKVAKTDVGPVLFELGEHLDGDTPYPEFLMKHGEGLQHLGFTVQNLEDVDKTAEILAKEGYPSLVSGRYGDNGAYNYIDMTQPLHAIWETYHMADNMGVKPPRYPDTVQTSPAKVKVNSIQQVGIVVKDVWKTVENYWNILGIGPWDVYEAVPPTFHDVIYRGKPGNPTMRIAFATVGQVQIGLLQSISGDNICSDFIAEHGEGLFYLQFLVDDINETTRIMNKEGFATLMSGGFSDGAFAFYDTARSLKAIWVALQPAKMWLPMIRYP